MGSFVTEFTPDEHGTITIGRWGGWIVQIVPMIYNHRLVLSPEDAPEVYDYGWCYPQSDEYSSSLPPALGAAIMWDPQTEGEPHGYIKAIGTKRREPGEVAK